MQYFTSSDLQEETVLSLLPSLRRISAAITSEHFRGPVLKHLEAYRKLCPQVNQVDIEVEP
jgi:hypothetical protein